MFWAAKRPEPGDETDGDGDRLYHFPFCDWLYISWVSCLDGFSLSKREKYSVTFYIKFVTLSILSRRRMY